MLDIYHETNSEKALKITISHIEDQRRFSASREKVFQK